MPITFKRAVFKSGDSFRITIPMEIIKALEIKEKEKLTIWLTDSQIVMEKDKLTDSMMNVKKAKK